MAKTVLMALMGLEIGGAETHVVELSKELSRRGWNVVVASAGGVYVEELTACGIRHCEAPLNRNDPRVMLRGFFALRRIIREVQPDVVHAHARIPAFLCGLLKRIYKFPFVTSAHWVFKVTPLLRLLTNWGQKSIAVSDDIKEYLIENYGMSPEDISVTINGIDTEKFSPAVAPGRVMEELGLSPGVPVIMHVSRLDDSRALVARQLVAASESIDARVPGARLVIVGDGDAAGEIRESAARVNAALGREMIIMTGARTDIGELVAAGDVFVGVSRAALEAMSAAKPVVIAGNEGYIGLFTADKLALAQENNFCCRGCPMPTPELLAQDIAHALIDLDEPAREQLGRDGRETIFREYSVSRMAEDAEAVYKSVIPPKKLLMSGYYGYNNLGDEAILRSVSSRIHEMMPDAEVSVLSNAPAVTAAEYGVHAVERFDPVAVLGQLDECDLLLSGGGSLLQDRTSTRSLLYYLWVIRGAKRRGKPVILYANGIGPVTRPRNRRIMRRVLERVDVITLREQDSLDELRRMGVTNSRMSVTADPVFLIEGVAEPQARELAAAAGIPTDRPIVGVSVRDCEGMDDAVPELARFCDGLVTRFGCTVVFLLMQLPHDEGVSTRIREAMRENSYVFSSPYHPERMMGLISLMEGVVSMRLHTLIFAAKQRVPLMGIVYDPKVASYLDALGMESCGTPRSFTAQAALEAYARLEAQREAKRCLLDERVSALERAAEENEKLLFELL